MFFKHLLFTVLIVFCSIHLLTAQGASFSQAKVLFYNVENLFNPENNAGKNDDEFQPDGLRRWTHYRKKQKQNNIARVILFAGKWEPPVLVGLCEVEDRQVLEGLVWNTGLHNLDYYIEHYESPDERGIDVALLYRNDRFKILNARAVPVFLGDSYRPTRDILYIKGVLDQTDTLHVMVNHWPSRWGGEGTTRSKRKAAAKVLKMICDSVQNISPNAAIIVMGDFNDGPSDESLRMFSKAPEEESGLLINLAHNARGEVPGTIKYKHEWSCFDQILVSENLCSNNGENGLLLKECGMDIIAPVFLLEEDPEYPGVRLKRTYRGYNYRGGFSDHLPVMIELKKKK